MSRVTHSEPGLPMVHPDLCTFTKIRCVDILRFFYTSRFVQFVHKGERDRWIDYRVYKRRTENDRKHGKFVAAKRGSHLLLGSPCLQRYDGSAS